MSLKLTKTEIIEKIQNDHGLSKKNISDVFDTIFNEIKTALLEGKSIELRRFGTFQLKYRKPRDKARNPRTGEVFKIGSYGVISFKPGRDLKKGARQITPSL